MDQTAKVSELKAKLSGYLAQVRRGATVTVCDRQTRRSLCRSRAMSAGSRGHRHGV